MDRKSCTALMAAILFSKVFSPVAKTHDQLVDMAYAKDCAEKLWDIVDEDDEIIQEKTFDSFVCCTCDCKECENCSCKKK
jgi:hypothetical protein